jgi:hypothetical protein
MKNYIITILAVCLLISISLLYKGETKRIFKDFPSSNIEKSEEIEGPLHLYLFFSRDNCADCLEVIDVLNTLPEHFLVKGVVPEKELASEDALRKKSGAMFPIIGLNGYRKFSPYYWPTLIGVTKSNKILFVLPGVPNEKKYLEEFLNPFYRRVYPLLIETK